MAREQEAGLGTEVLVVGSGIAGLTAALRASRHADVLLVTKTELADGSTRHAQGGIAGALDPSDSPAAHARDTLAAGAGLGETEAVRVLCQGGPDAIADLIARGVDFDRAADGTYACGLEGAHGRPRILHAGGDATGRAIVDALVAAVRVQAAGESTGSLTVLEHAALEDLLVQDGRVVGAELLTADGSRRPVHASATVLATGGAGQLFSHTTNPVVATGDGIAAAWRAGAALEDLEFYQFHPTALAVPGSFLLSEAVRGEGAVLRDEQGRRFLPGIDPRAELAPRDVVARAIAQVMAVQDGRPVLLDATGIGAERLRERFPTIDAAVRAAGFDWGSRPVPVTPAAHYWMGGIRTDLEGRTSLPGLSAAGECARTGVHGANRLASNSLLEGAVFGARAGDAAAGAARAGVGLTGAARAGVGLTGAAELPSASPAPGQSASTGVIRASSAIYAEAAHRAPVDTPPSPPSPPCALPGVPSRDVVPTSPPRVDPTPWTRSALQELMWSHVGLLRTGEQLTAAAAQLAVWQGPDPAALTTVGELEDRNLLDLARLLTAHALARTTSVGAHHRLDDPSVAPDDRIPAPDPSQEALAC
ncbi:L-aspartate oxidase [Brachybacterium fresconis]|uniref:L-aspartate oxidase n=1 Tax=Brachybacterium fresconis TaxID=173363 RepID=A0ABS4YMK6_9MICO|nr:L-aspartate oxidase [Brachybacterium fresconis]MBP2410035.1 L-aspartate oxidase [Brachybacterium fresconis]